MSCAVLGGLLLTPARADAAPLTVDVRYERPGDLAGCLTDDELERAVAGRLPADTVVEHGPNASVSVTIRIAGEERTGLRATIALDERGRADTAVQELVASARECRTLGAAAALAASLAVEHSIERLREEARPAPPTTTATATPLPAPSPATSPERPPAPTRARPRRRRARPTPRAPSIGIRSHAAALVGYGIAPAPTAGALAGASIQLGSWRVGLDVGAFLPAEVASPRGGGANASLTFVGLSPCRHVDRFEGCAVVSLGDFRAAGTGPLVSRSSHALYTSLGLRGGYEVFRAAPFSFVVHAGLLVPLVRPSIRIGDEPLWRAAPVAGEAGLSWRITIL